MKKIFNFNYAVYNNGGNKIKSGVYKLNGKNIIYGYLNVFWQTKQANTWKSACKYVDGILQGPFKRDAELFLSFLVLSKEFGISRLVYKIKDKISNRPNVYVAMNVNSPSCPLTIFNISKEISTILLNLKHIKRLSHPAIKNRFTSFYEQSKRTLHLFDPICNNDFIDFDYKEMFLNTINHYKKLVSDLKEMRCVLNETQFGEYYLAKYKNYVFGIEKTIFEKIDKGIEIKSFSEFNKTKFTNDCFYIYSGIFICDQTVE